MLLEHIILFLLCYGTLRNVCVKKVKKKQAKKRLFSKIFKNNDINKSQVLFFLKVIDFSIQTNAFKSIAIVIFKNRHCRCPI